MKQNDDKKTRSPRNWFPLEEMKNRNSAANIVAGCFNGGRWRPPPANFSMNLSPIKEPRVNSQQQQQQQQQLPIRSEFLLTFPIRNWRQKYPPPPPLPPPGHIFHAHTMQSIPAHCNMQMSPILPGPQLQKETFKLANSQTRKLANKQTNLSNSLIQAN